MNRGDRVKVYSDPLTQTQLEGDATIEYIHWTRRLVREGKMVTQHFARVAFADGARVDRFVVEEERA